MRHYPIVMASLLALTSFALANNPNVDKPSADNTRVNQRDRGDSAMTADNQSNSKSDIEVTRRIRRGLVKDDSLSMSAKNVKIITNDGMVTLKGPVESQAEVSKIERSAKRVAGVKQIDNQLEVDAG